MTKLGMAGAVTCALAAAWAPVLAQESTNRVAAKTDWSVFVEQEPTECWGVSAPKETVNTRDGRVVAVRRGDILLFVTYRPSDSRSRARSPSPAGTPSPRAPRSRSRLATRASSSSPTASGPGPRRPSDDAKITTSMKRGTNATLTARSSRGTVTKDTFSLLGFTAALEEAERRCTS